MCGIVGIAGKSDAAPVILEALKRLEYRGYDSAGIATLVEGRIERRRAPGKLANLAETLRTRPLAGRTGIGHTRWATHGAATEANAHPHASARVALVHNGIVENFHALREELISEGHAFESETDTEVAVHLVTRYLDRGLDPVRAAIEASRRIAGAYAIAMIFGGEEGLVVGVRRGSPLAVGYGADEGYLGSDAIALAPFTNRVSYLEDGDVVAIRGGDIAIQDSEGRPANREIEFVNASAGSIDKAGYRHFMAKEIHEQPEAAGHTLTQYLDPESLAGSARLGDALKTLAKTPRLAISGCGTAFHAGLIGRYWFEKLARLPVDADIASELRYRDPPSPGGGAALFISQSGETADALAALRDAKRRGQTAIAIVNVRESTMAREADIVLPTFAGPEIGVASTKAFTCQLAVLACLAIATGRERGVLPAGEERRLAASLMETPRRMVDALAREDKIESLGFELAKARGVLYLGRGVNYPIALEGALKLKEISYIHAEGHAAGELKHGPIAMIDESMPVVVIAPSDALFGKTISNMQEVMARGGRVVLVSDSRGIGQAGDRVWATIEAPECDPLLAPLLYAVPMQLLAYYTAVAKGTDVDQPRNLAKSVTVE